jgi:HTH-type transcriptional regulator/antitoxin HigA
MTKELYKIGRIRGPEAHSAALARISSLIDLDPASGSEGAAELEILAMLVEQYERETFAFDEVDPITAIKLRMTQRGMRPADLVPMLGSRARVSEILSGKRNLSVRMMRELNRHLGIPGDVLLREPIPQEDDESDANEGEDWRDYPVSEMVKLGWVSATSPLDRPRALREFFSPIIGEWTPAIAFRRSLHVRTSSKFSRAATLAWIAKVARDSVGIADVANYSEPIDEHFARFIVSLSRFADGPERAVRELRGRGIRVVFVRHLRRTHIDGASFMLPNGSPVIGLTVRHDRLDNFWFTLAHELAHIKLHFRDNSIAFVDDIESHREKNDSAEAEADAFASELLVPELEWSRSSVRRLQTPATVLTLAERIGVHHSIVAGRARHERNNFTILADMVGRGQVRSRFFHDSQRSTED